MSTQSTIQINNLTSSYLSLDVRNDKFSDKVLRYKLAPKGAVGLPHGQSSSIDAAQFGFTLEELQANTQIQQLLNNLDAKGNQIVPGFGPLISVSVARGTNDLSPSSFESVATSGGLATDYRQAFAFAAGVGGAGDDVPLYIGNFPFAAEITDVEMQVTTNIAGATLQLWTATGGSGGTGNALSDLFATATAGRYRDTGAASGSATLLAGVVPVIAAGTSIYLHRGHNTCAGTVIIDFTRLS